MIQVYCDEFCDDITLPKTNRAHLKMNGWKTIVSFSDGGNLEGAISVS